ncbi:MAG: transposase [bacterium]
MWVSSRTLIKDVMQEDNQRNDSRRLSLHDWLAAITSHIPNKGAQNVRYYGAYSNKSRGLRKKEQDADNEILIADSNPLKNLTVKSWTLLINQMCEVAPLTCSRCPHQMRIISIIDQPQILEKILRHLDLWQPQAHGSPLKKEEKIVEETIYDYSYFDYLPT